MDKNKFITDFSKLGELINEALQTKIHNDLLTKAEQENKWFSKESILFTLNELVNSLSKKKLEDWLSNYQIPPNAMPKLIGLVLAGNIPLVGFHDILCTLATGNNILAKLSHKDQVLYTLIKNLLIAIDNEYDKKIIFTTDTLKNIDAIIATGSNNSARYFEYYFGKYPNIIRRNRNSVAIIDASFTNTDYKELGKDIFTYFGLGCRNVSYILIPDKFDIEILFRGLEMYEHVIEHNKYANNYNYQKAILAMNQIPFYDTGFCLFTENESLNSPIGTIHFGIYKNKTEIENYVKTHNKEIQCIVSKTKYSFKTYSLGMAQKPAFNDYADNIDTVEFLINL